MFIEYNRVIKSNITSEYILIYTCTKNRAVINNCKVSLLYEKDRTYKGSLKIKNSENQSLVCTKYITEKNYAVNLLEDGEVLHLAKDDEVYARVTPTASMDLYMTVGVLDDEKRW